MRNNISKNRLFFLVLNCFLGFCFASIDVSRLEAAAAPKKEEKSGGAQTSQVEIPGIVIPVANGKRLVNYSFLTIVVHAQDARAADIVRNNTFLVKDAIVRGGSRSPISVSANNYIDKNAVALWLKGIIQGAFNGVIVTRIEVKSLDLMY